MGIFHTVLKRKQKEPERIIPQVQKERLDMGGQVYRGSGEGREVDRTGISGRGSTIVPARHQKPALRDPGKRQRIFIVAALVVLFVFGVKVWQPQDWKILEIVGVSASASLLSVLGLLWAFRFEVRREGYLTVLPQPAMFVFGYVLFVEMFFFQQFERLYEALVFGIFLLVFMVVLGIVFLTANVLNVSTFKTIPLVQVAQTSSYAITLFVVFFLGFFVINIGWNVPGTVGVLFVVYWLAAFMHLSHFGLPRRSVTQYVTVLSVCSTLAAWIVMLWPVDTLFRVLLPTVIIYIGLGIVMHDVRRVLRPLVNWEYFLIILVVIVLIVSRAVWGIGGYVWS